MRGKKGTIIQRPDGKFEVRIRVKVRDLRGGPGATNWSEIRRRFDTEAEAEDFWFEENRRQRDGAALVGNTVADFCDYFFEVKKAKGWTGLTARTNRSHLNAAAAHFGDCLLRDLRRQDLIVWINELDASGLKVDSVNRKIAPFLQALRVAYDMELIPKDITTRLNRPKKEEPETIPPTTAQAISIEQAAYKDSHDFGVLISLAFLTGLRRQELLALRWSDIDFDNGVFTIRRAISYDYDGNVIVKSTKTGKPRTIALGPDGLELLRNHRDVTRRRAEQFNVLHLDQFLFVSNPLDDVPMRPDSITKKVRVLRKRLGITGKVTLHSFRHYQGTMLVANQIGVSNVASRLGHADGGRTTLERYAHALGDVDRDAALLIERLRRQGSTG